MKRKIGVIVTMMIFSLSVVGCQNSGSNVTDTISSESEQTKEASEQPKLSICEDEPMCFKVGKKKVSLEEQAPLASAIMDVRWINENLIGITTHVTPSNNYFIVYNNNNAKFEYGAYGYDFVWKDGDIETLVYIETTPKNTGAMSHYWITNYIGDVIYESKEPITDLKYEEDGKVHFQVEKEEGVFSEESIENYK